MSSSITKDALSSARLKRPPLDSDVAYRIAQKTRATRLPGLKGNNRGSFVGAFVAWSGDRWETHVFESRHELLTAYILMANPGFESLWSQPPRVQFLGFDGKIHHHTFDFLVVVNGKKYAVACKFASSVLRLNFKHQLACIKAQLNGFADEILLVTEQDYTVETALVAELYHFMRREHDDEADLAVAKVISSLSGSTTIDDLVRATGLKARAWRAIVRAVGSRQLAIVGKNRIDDYGTAVAKVAE
jgi:hypothetical protein